MSQDEIAERIAGRPAASHTQFDERGALERVDNDRELLAEVVGSFLETIGADLDELDQQLAAGDAAMARRVAHRIKGAFGAVGAGILASRAFAIESAREAPCDDLVPLAREIRNLADVLRTELQGFLDA
jgi:HPt (histidine-containing phosphotransfer) domain-containing protein